MKNHRDEYIEIRDGAITYFEKADERSDDVIKLYENGKDQNRKMNIVAIIKQRDSHKKVFLDSMEEFDKLKEEIESEAKKEDKDAEIEEKEIADGEIELQNAADDNSSEEGAVEKEKDIASEIKELEEKAKAMEEAGKLLEGDLDSINGFKNNLMEKSVDAKTLLGARAAYEQAQDRMNLTTAKYMIEKNILVAKREAIILDVNRAIAVGEDISSLQYSLIDINNQVENLDKEYEIVFPSLQREVAGAQKELKECRKEISEKVEASFQNSYKEIRKYSEDGILQSETTDLTRDLKRVVHNTSYAGNIVADGKKNSISEETINYNGKTIRVRTTAYSNEKDGVETSFMDGNIEQLRTGVGDVEYYTTSQSGDIIADNPEREKEEILKYIEDSKEEIAKAKDKDKDVEEEPELKMNN